VSQRLYTLCSKVNYSLPFLLSKFNLSILYYFFSSFMKPNMKSPFRIVLSMMLLVVLSSSANAQLNWSTLSTQPANPSTVSYVTTGQVAVATLTNYLPWTTLVYSYPTAPAVGNGTMQVGFVGDFTGKMVFVFLTDATGKTTSMDVNALLSIPYSSSVTSSTPTENYSIDLNLVNKQTGFSLSSIAKVNFIIYNDASGTTSPTLANSHLLINAPVFGTGTTGMSTALNPALNQEWTMESNGYLFNSNNHGVIVGSPTANNVGGLLSYPYYNFIVNGRTNFVGNDNAVEIWSANVPASGFRHYMGIANLTFPSTTTEYSVINVNEWNGATANPKHLTLQNYADPNGAGNVGIGYHAVAPSEKLSVNGKVLVMSTNIPSSGYRQMMSFGNNTFANATEFALINSYEWNYTTATSNAKHLILQNYSNNPNGNVGIGYHTSAPLEKLSVNGNIRCKQLIGTQLSWSDYVFAPTYKLRSLNEVKSYIEKEKHLPNIPSEKEIVENGLNMNTMLQLHMEKIEELTLYLIKQEEVMKAQQAEIDRLKKQMELLAK
jgi:hypothetical protein